MWTTAKLFVTTDTALSIQTACPLIIARILALSALAHLAVAAVRVRHTRARQLRPDTRVLIAHQVTTTIAVHAALDLLTADLLVVRVAVEAVRTGAHRAVGFGRADGVAAANDRATAHVLALKEAVFTAHTSVALTAIQVVGAA